MDRAQDRQAHQLAPGFSCVGVDETRDVKFSHGAQDVEDDSSVTACADDDDIHDDPFHQARPRAVSNCIRLNLYRAISLPSTSTTGMACLYFSKSAGSSSILRTVKSNSLSRRTVRITSSTGSQRWQPGFVYKMTCFMRGSIA